MKRQFRVKLWDHYTVYSCLCSRDKYCGLPWHQPHQSFWSRLEIGAAEPTCCFNDQITWIKCNSMRQTETNWVKNLHVSWYENGNGERKKLNWNENFCTAQCACYATCFHIAHPLDSSKQMRAGHRSSTSRCSFWDMACQDVSRYIYQNNTNVVIHI